MVAPMPLPSPLSTEMVRALSLRAQSKWSPFTAYAGSSCPASRKLRPPSARPGQEVPLHLGGHRQALPPTRPPVVVGAAVGRGERHRHLVTDCRQSVECRRRRLLGEIDREHAEPITPGGDRHQGARTAVRQLLVEWPLAGEDTRGGGLIAQRAGNLVLRPQRRPQPGNPVVGQEHLDAQRVEVLLDELFRDDGEPVRFGGPDVLADRWCLLRHRFTPVGNAAWPEDRLEPAGPAESAVEQERQQRHQQQHRRISVLPV